MLYRVQEWIADRVRFVQYPRVREAMSAQRKPAVWGQNFSWMTKIGLALLGLPLFLIGVVGFVAAVYLLWVIVSSLFAT